MDQALRLIGVMVIVALNAFSAPATAEEMTFQMVNDTEFALNFKLFSHGESRRQWPSKTKAYLINPGTDARQIKIDCDDGEKICWGAWTKVQNVSGEIAGPNGERRTHRTNFNAGVGERGQRTCERCCHVCKDGALVPAITLRDRNSAGK